MAHMHSRHKGRAGSNRPPARTAPSWVQASAKEVEALILQLAKEGKKEADIGRILRDSQGIPSVRHLTGKTVSQVLKEHGAAPEFPSDLIGLIERAVGLRRHLKSNKHDTLNKAALTRTESKIRRLARYYRGKSLPGSWKYDPEKAALLVK